MENNPTVVKKTIFIVEDSFPLRELYKEVLSDAGYAVKSFSSGEEALAKMPTLSPPHLLVVDFSLAEMSGEDFIRKIKDKMPGLSETLIAGCSGHSLDSPVIQSFKRCTNAYLEKHRDLDELVESINAMFGIVLPKNRSGEGQIETYR